MPIYEYRCSDCGFQDEYLQKLSEPPLTACPSCGKPAFQKQVSAAGFQLKGSGWYATDFKSSGKPAQAKTETQAEGKADTKVDAKVDAKADAKPAAGSDTQSEAKSEAKVKAEPAATSSD
ncbi:MAG TPA: zinc ribbon domain-containing protein [Burkholderiales bacterium]|nr:zinc ribbon domain-containing protein [Burkholderiales bacterium]